MRKTRKCNICSCTKDLATEFYSSSAKGAPRKRYAYSCKDCTRSKLIRGYAERRKTGLCVKCDRRVVTGKTRCAEHLKEMAEQSAKQHAKRTENGLCLLCGKESPNGVHCTKHAIERNKKSAKKELERKRSGLCVRCGLSAFNGGACCEKHTKINNKKRRARRFEFKKKLVELRGGKCMDCGFVTECINVYDFHHRDPSTKIFSLSGSRMVTKRWDEILEELEKCDMLCNRCHRIRHWLESSYQKDEYISHPE